MNKINIDIAATNAKEVGKILNTLLADEFLLYTKTRNYHWNVKGPRFHDLHLFFEKQYEELEQIVDEVAERARMLGENAEATLKEFLDKTRIKEEPGEYPDSKTMIAHLLKDHETIIRELRKDVDVTNEKYKDAGTCDFLTGVMEQHEKAAWMLRSLVEG